MLSHNIATLLAIITFFNDLQFSKASIGITVTLPGLFMLSNDSQSAKALGAISGWIC